MLENVNAVREAYEKLMAFEKPSAEQKLALDRLILVVAGGSQAYGTYRPDSDVDIRGITVGLSKHYLGLGRFDQAEFTRPGTDNNEKDTVYELKKFVKLAADANPNIIEMLFSHPEHYMHVTDEGLTLIAHRHLFLSKRAVSSFSGYAYSQIKRIQSHYNRIQSGPVPEPIKEHYMTIPRYRSIKDPTKIIPVGDYEAKMKRVAELKAAAMGPVDEEDKSFFESANNWELIYVLNKDAYEKDMRDYKQDQDWRKNRNEERAGLEAQYGYDTKHASHVGRLLLQVKKILQFGTFETYLPADDLAFVRDIRAGKMTYQELLRWAKETEEEVYALEKSSKLPYSPDYDRIDEMLENLLLSRFDKDRVGNLTTDSLGYRPDLVRLAQEESMDIR